MVTKLLLTSEEFFDVVGGLPKDRRYELICGEMYEMGGVTKRHGEVAGEFSARFREWNREHRAGSVGVEVGFTLHRGPDTVRVPDVYFLAKGRVSAQASRRGYPEAAPDLVVEVRSPNDTWQSLVDRANALLAAGSRMAVLVEPDQFIEVHRPGRESRRLGLEDVFDGEDVLPGFRCRVGEFFPEEY